MLSSWNILYDVIKNILILSRENFVSLKYNLINMWNIAARMLAKPARFFKFFHEQFLGGKKLGKYNVCKIQLLKISLKC